MNLEILSSLTGEKKNLWTDFLSRAGLEADAVFEQTVLLWDGDSLVACGSRQGNLLKCIAVDAARQGEGLTATVLTALRQEAFQAGHRHLFLYTKPENRAMFASLFFYPVADTDRVLLMENRKDGVLEFLSSLPCTTCSGIVGSVVMNANPFTLGHQYLIETAAKECDHLYVFVLSEDKSRFSADDRIAMVKLGCGHLSNVTVLPTGPYLISSATFPTYFLKERELAGQVQCRLDIEIFTRYFAPHFSITRRYVGTEPLSPMTAQYNEELKKHLPASGIEVTELSRFSQSEIPVSASAVRAMIDEGNIHQVRNLIPATTFDYLKTKGLLN